MTKQPTQPFRPLTDYEAMVFRFMDRCPYTQGHGAALARAKTAAEYESVIERAVERYADWASD
jgi:hypothetical protein